MYFGCTIYLLNWEHLLSTRQHIAEILFCYIFLFSVLGGSHFNALKNETAALDSAAIHLIAILCEILDCQRFVNLTRLNNIPTKLSYIIAEDC